jgi:hypothetical protein
VDDFVLKVYMIPGELAQLAGAQAERDRQHEERFEPSVFICVGVESEFRAAEPVPLENTIRPVACGLVVASGGVRVFVDQAVQDGFSADPLDIEVSHGGWGSVVSGIGDMLSNALMRPGAVVVRLVFGQDGAQVGLAEDQHAVEELAAQGADKAFAGRVHPRSLNGAPENPGADSLEDGVEGLGEV